MTQPPVYQLRDVSLRRGELLVLQSLNVKIDWGERVAIIGASGAGKSSLLQLLNGALKPSTGTLHIPGAMLRDHFDLDGTQLDLVFTADITATAQNL